MAMINSLLPTLLLLAALSPTTPQKARMGCNFFSYRAILLMRKSSNQACDRTELRCGAVSRLIRSFSNDFRKITANACVVSVRPDLRFVVLGQPLGTFAAQFEVSTSFLIS
jgi:hypothetical protein